MNGKMNGLAHIMKTIIMEVMNDHKNLSEE